MSHVNLRQIFCPDSINFLAPSLLLIDLVNDLNKGGFRGCISDALQNISDFFFFVFFSRIRMLLEVLLVVK